MLKKTKSISMTDYLVQMKSLADSLTAANVEFFQSTLIDFIIDGLGTHAMHRMMVNTSSYFDNAPNEVTNDIYIGDGSPLSITHIGTIFIELEFGLINFKICSVYQKLRED